MMSSVMTSNMKPLRHLFDIQERIKLFILVTKIAN